MSQRTKTMIARFGPLVAGLLVAFSLPPWGWWPLTFLGIAVLDQALAYGTYDPLFSTQRLVQGFIFAFAWLSVGMFWMWDMTLPGYLIAAVFFPLFYGLGFALLPISSDIWRRVGLVGVLVLAGVARWSWPFGGVPLATLAMTQADSPLGPTVRTFGTLTLVALVGIVGVGVSAAIDRQWRFVQGSAGVLLAIGVLTLLVPFGDTIRTLDIAIVQGGGPQNTRAITSDSRKVFERHGEATRLVEGPVDLILWPENVVDLRGNLVDNIEFTEIASLAAEMGAPIIPGITESFGGEEPYYTNASLVVEPNADVIARYDKVRLVPYGEFVPFRWLVEAFAPAALTTKDARAGTGPAVLATGADRFGDLGISISWEIFFDTRARDAISNGGTILVNPTNGSSYWLTILQSQQVASSQLRAMETGRYVLQAAPTGFSAIVTPGGDVIDRSGVSEQKVIQGTVELRDGLTWAVRWGRTPMIIAALAAFALSLGASRFRLTRR